MNDTAISTEIFRLVQESSVVKVVYMVKRLTRLYTISMSCVKIWEISFNEIQSKLSLKYRGYDSLIRQFRITIDNLQNENRLNDNEHINMSSWRLIKNTLRCGENTISRVERARPRNKSNVFQIVSMWHATAISSKCGIRISSRYSLIANNRSERLECFWRYVTAPSPTSNVVKRWIIWITIEDPS